MLEIKFTPLTTISDSKAAELAHRILTCPYSVSAECMKREFAKLNKTKKKK